MRRYGAGPGEIGGEPTLEAYLKALVGVFREVRRVLRPDGTLFLNIGDSYLAGTSFGTACIPWLLAFALKADGWVVRQEIIWEKTNTLPDGSTRNRCTRAHETIFLLVKGRGYYFDGDALRNDSGSLPRSVWRFSHGRVWTPPGESRGKESHAAFPKELADRCVRAGTSDAGSCIACGACWRRRTERVGAVRPVEAHDVNTVRVTRDRSFRWSRHGTGTIDGVIPQVVTTGWEPGCGCACDAVPCVVLDPFLGTGTTAAACLALGRRCIGVELNRRCLDQVAVPRLWEAVRAWSGATHPCPGSKGAPAAGGSRPLTAVLGSGSRSGTDGRDANITRAAGAGPTQDRSNAGLHPPAHRPVAQDRTPCPRVFSSPE
jgi:site-specific DNA-methyltransferase (adenine-specific)